MVLPETTSASDQRLRRYYAALFCTVARSRSGASAGPNVKRLRAKAQAHQPTISVAQAPSLLPRFPSVFTQSGEGIGQSSLENGTSGCAMSISSCPQILSSGVAGCVCALQDGRLVLDADGRAAKAQAYQSRFLRTNGRAWPLRHLTHGDYYNGRFKINPSSLASAWNTKTGLVAHGPQVCNLSPDLLLLFSFFLVTEVSRIAPTYFFNPQWQKHIVVCSDVQ
jgi:hypothetical protein